MSDEVKQGDVVRASKNLSQYVRDFIIGFFTTHCYTIPLCLPLRLAQLLVIQGQNTQVLYEVGFCLWLMSYNVCKNYII